MHFDKWKKVNEEWRLQQLVTFATKKIQSNQISNQISELVTDIIDAKETIRSADFLSYAQKEDCLFDVYANPS